MAIDLEKDFAYKNTRDLVNKLRDELGGVVSEVKKPLLNISKNAKQFSDVYSDLSKSIKTTSDNLNQAIDKTTETLLQKDGLLGIDNKELNKNIGATQGLTVVLEEQLKNRKDLSKEEKKALRGQIKASKEYIKQVTGFSSATKGLAAAVRSQVVENFGPEEIIGQLDKIPIIGGFLKGVGLDLLRQRKARKDAAKEAIAEATRNKLQEDRDNVKLSKAKQKQAETIEEQTKTIKKDEDGDKEQTKTIKKDEDGDKEQIQPIRKDEDGDKEQIKTIKKDEDGAEDLAKGIEEFKDIETPTFDKEQTKTIKKDEDGDKEQIQPVRKGEDVELVEKEQIQPIRKGEDDDKEQIKIIKKNEDIELAEKEQTESIKKDEDDDKEQTESIRKGEDVQSAEAVEGGVVTISESSIATLSDAFKNALMESQPKKDDPSKLAENKEKKRQRDKLKKGERIQRDQQTGKKGAGLGALGVGLAAKGIAGAVIALTGALTAAGAATPAILAGGAAIGGGLGAILAGIGIGAVVGGAGISAGIKMIGEAIDGITSPLTNLKSAVEEFEDLDGEKLTQAADGMGALAGPLAKTSLAGFLTKFVGENGIQNLKGLAGAVKEYETLDGSKLEEVALGLGAMGEPLKDAGFAGIIARFADPTVLGALATSVKEYENLDPSKLGETADALGKFGPALSDFAGESALASFKGFVGGLADFITIGDDPIEKLTKFGDIADPLNDATDAINKFQPTFEKFFNMIEGKSFENVGDSFKDFADGFRDGAEDLAKGIEEFEDIETPTFDKVSNLIESVANLTRAQQVATLSSENVQLGRIMTTAPTQPMINNTVTNQNNSQGVVINRSVNNDNLDTRISLYN